MARPPKPGKPGEVIKRSEQWQYTVRFSRMYESHSSDTGVVVVIILCCRKKLVGFYYHYYEITGWCCLLQLLLYYYDDGATKRAYNKLERTERVF